MFNGIIEETGRVVSVRNLVGGKELTIRCDLAGEMKVDNSLCVNGVCQTVVRKDPASVTVQVVEETLRKTALGNLRSGDEVNLERSMTLAQRIDGHIVQGHVDTTGPILDVSREGANWLIRIGLDPQWSDLIVGRGSIAVDGVSLTVARVTADSFLVAIIPYTWEHTVLRNRKKGSVVNLEFDILGKYVVQFLKNRTAARQSDGMLQGDEQASGVARTTGAGGVSEEILRKSGFTG